MMKLEFLQNNNMAPPTGPVMTCNTTCNPRGWNDPPPYIFSPNAGTNRSRIDPRKRVGHDLNSAQVTNVTNQPTALLNGMVQPGYANPNTSPVTGAPVSNGMVSNGMVHPGYANGSVPSYPTTSTDNAVQAGNIPLENSNCNFATNQISPMLNSYNVPHNVQLHDQSHANGQPVVHNMATPPPASNFSPLFQVTPGNQNITFSTQSSTFPTPSLKTCPPPSEFAATTTRNIAPPSTNDGNANVRRLGAPTNSMNSSIFSQLSTPTMLQSSHLPSKSAKREMPTTTIKTDAALNATAMNNNFRSISPVPHIDGITESPSQCNGIAHPIFPVYNGPASHMSHLPPMSGLPPMSSLPPMPVTGGIPEQMNSFSRANSLPGLAPGKSSVAPPVDGFYVNKTSNGLQHSPKNMSPRTSGTNSPVPVNDKLIENDSELLNDTINRLIGCRHKCACVLTNKTSEDINKRIQAFKLAWTSDKLSAHVKLEMSNLSAALDKREFLQADSIHKSLIVSNSSEVISWIIGVKKLISSYQKVVEDNNQY